MLRSDDAEIRSLAVEIFDAKHGNYIDYWNIRGWDSLGGDPIRGSMLDVYSLVVSRYGAVKVNLQYRYLVQNFNINKRTNNDKK